MVLGGDRGAGALETLAARYTVENQLHDVLRFDDTNPEKENQEYVDAIIDSVRWLGFDWTFPDGECDLYYASDYFETFYQIALKLIEAGHAYVDSQTGDQIRENRGTLLKIQKLAGHGGACL